MKLSLVVLILVFLYIGCTFFNQGQGESKSHSTSLPEPKWTPKNTPTSTLESADVSEKIINDMLRQVTIICGDNKGKCASNEKARYFSALHEAIEFLVSEFGKARYSGNIDLIISRDPKTNGKMLWQRKLSKVRRLHINEINFEKTEWRILVHELFHAYYENDFFIMSHPDFINEGLAVYAEYKYRYRGKTNIEIAKIMRNHAEALGYPAQLTQLDYNAPFGYYEGRTLDLIYIVSGLFFMRQDSDLIASKIAVMLNVLSKVNVEYKKISFQKLIQAYGLDNNEYSLIPPPLPPPIVTIR